MRRAYKFLLRPTVKQVQTLGECLEAHRLLYNAALQERREAWQRAGVTIRYGDQSAQLKDIRRADPGQACWSFSSQQATLRRLNLAFDGFFRRVKAGQTPGYPRFKGRGWWDTVVWPKDGDGCRWDPPPDSGLTRVYLQGVGHVRVHAHRRVEGRVKTISVKREGTCWYVILSCGDVPAQTLPPVNSPVGVDMGVAAFLTTNHGVQVPNPRYLAASADRLTQAQQALARCERGSRRRGKARSRVAAVHRRVARQRLDHAHKTARWLVTHHDLICHEKLRITNMTRSAAGTVDAPGVNVAAKSGLNRSILDAGWGVFLRVLASKAESAGRMVIAVNPANTSRTCPHCGHCARENRPTQADFTCVACGYHGHADVVAASNVLRAGLALQTAQPA
ncbi:RNA-guided endonuclease InsQ/TnpB family protein [Micromonospora polyrhachis]|uniref:Putative transposase n=1 Tax=Micromonospora polyrhachis TaxID=1282883 RepID=A0A7W7SQ86_9ACTN|nr:RNA-guided endonuclease TnpB family protein [Micromonospora polyrhachis]MBB4958347.1 putative transposase [Micromonospora polyrhachis]